MNDTSLIALSPSQQLEIETLRDQRDLYRALLLSEPVTLASGLGRALGSVEQLRSLLRAPTRDGPAFRGKIEQLLAELGRMSESLLDLHLPTVGARLQRAQRALGDLEQRPALAGNDLLPAMVVLGELCSHITMAADCASVHVPLLAEGQAPDASQSTRTGALPKLALALRQLAERIASEQGKHVTLVILGLEEIPEPWVGALFDLIGQLLRNAIEHGIEAPGDRMARGKPEQGTLVVEFIACGARGFELSVQDDGSGLDAARIIAAAIGRGLLDEARARELDPPQLASLIFQPGLSTAADAARRGNGMQIVRDHVLRLGGKIQAATKSGQYTRFRIRLPAAAGAGRPAGVEVEAGGGA